MAKRIEVVVAADPDQEDCLAAAAAEYISEHPVLAGWDLYPRWTDETRETVTLSVPSWAVEMTWTS
jgi:hypothetical protein